MFNKINKNGIDLIKSFEELRLKAYICPAGKLTIGWGHTKGVYKGQEITLEQADAFLLDDLQDAQRAVCGLVKVPLTDNQYSSLVSFTFNVGSDIDKDYIAEGLGDSTLLKVLNDGFYDRVPIELVKWNKCKGIVLGGLTRRRNAEAKLWNTRV